MGSRPGNSCDPLGKFLSCPTQWWPEQNCLCEQDLLGPSVAVSYALREAPALGQSGPDLLVVFLGDATLIPVLK